MSSTKVEKRKFHYKLKSFEQIFGEIERLEEREAVLIKYLSRVMKLSKSCRVTAGDVGYDPDLAIHLEEVLQVMFDELSKLPGKSPGYTMINNLGIEFYENIRERILEEERND